MTKEWFEVRVKKFSPEEALGAKSGSNFLDSQSNSGVERNVGRKFSMGEPMKSAVPKASSDQEKIFRVLLVEDNLTFRQVVRDLLNYRFPSMVVDEATNGKEAMQIIHNHPPNLILMDIKLPGENGLELTRKITAKYPGMDVVILTSYDLPEYRQVAMQSGACSFVTKGSSTIDEIADLVDKFSKGSGRAGCGFPRAE